MTTPSEAPASLACPVHPARLRHGTWCHRTSKEIGKGDIAASYSADRIGMGQPLRKPFEWKGALWICVSIGGRRDHLTAVAYRLMLPQAFKGEPTTYHAKTRERGGDTARNAPSGFYHGTTVKHAGQPFVLCGPPAQFVAGEAEQRDLFSSAL
jgi:hypothetical protein